MSRSTTPATNSAQDHILPSTPRRRWTIVGLLFTASLINYFDRATISFALPLISKELHLGPEAKGVLLSAFFWSYALLQIPMGVLADRVNLRWLYAGAFTLWSVSQGLMGFATGLGTLIVFRMLLGIGEAIYLPGGSKIVSLLFRPAERGLPCGLFDAGTRTGLVIEGVLVPWMLIHYGWRASFSIVLYAALPYFVFGASEPIGGWIADRLIHRGVSETRARKGVVTVAFLTGLLLIPAARVNAPGAAVALIIGGCLVGLATANLLVILQSCAPRAEIGLWTGVYNFVGNIAGILSPLITGLLIERSGSYTPPFVLAAALIALGPLAIWFIVRDLRPADRQS